MFNLSSVAIAVHAVSAVVWVGGMVFAYTVLRPSLGAFKPPHRLALWNDVFSRFFVWVWIAVIALPVSGYALMFHHFGGFGGSPLYVHIMHGLGLVMICLFAVLYFGPYRHFKTAVNATDWPLAAKHLNTIRRIVATNMTLGLFTVIMGASGRFWS